MFRSFVVAFCAYVVYVFGVSVLCLAMHALCILFLTCVFLLVAFACVADLVTVTFMVCPCFTRLTYCFNEGKIKPGFMLTNALLLLGFLEPF